MPDVVATCIVLDNFCIINNEQIENGFLKHKNKSYRRSNEKIIQEGNELQEERAQPPKLNIKIKIREDVPIANEANDMEKINYVYIEK